MSSLEERIKEKAFNVESLRELRDDQGVLEGQINIVHAYDVIRVSDVSALLKDVVVLDTKKLRGKISTLSEAIHDALMKHDVKLRPYAKLVDETVWNWFEKEILE